MGGSAEQGSNNGRLVAQVSHRIISLQSESFFSPPHKLQKRNGPSKETAMNGRRESEMGGENHGRIE